MQVVLGMFTARVEIVTQNLGIDGQVVVGFVVPVGPVERGIGRYQRLVQPLVGGVVFLQRFTIRFLHLEEVVAAGCQGKGGGSAKCYDGYMLIHNTY